MKVSRPQKVFQPVVLTLESEDEVRIIRNALDTSDMMGLEEGVGMTSSKISKWCDCLSTRLQEVLDN